MSAAWYAIKRGSNQAGRLCRKRKGGLKGDKLARWLDYLYRVSTAYGGRRAAAEEEFCFPGWGGLDRCDFGIDGVSCTCAIRAAREELQMQIYDAALRD